MLRFGASREGYAYGSNRGKILDETKRAFKLEFLNRFDEILSPVRSASRS